MRPLWIIDLGEDETFTKRLSSLLEKVGASQDLLWYYTRLAGRDLSEVSDYISLINEVVKAGKVCYNTFMEKGLAVGNFQVVIIGSADEPFTQEAFVPLAGLIRDNLSRIVPGHVNLGVEITGILFIPMAINQDDRIDKRMNAALFLETVNLQMSDSGLGLFSRVLAYQDVQYEACRYYPKLDSSQRADFLFQILVAAFYAGDNAERGVDQLGDVHGIYAIGAASIYYSGKQHMAQVLDLQINRILKAFKNDAFFKEEYSDSIVKQIVQEAYLQPESISASLGEQCKSVDVNLKEFDVEANPNPAIDFFRSKLMPSYYGNYIKNTTARQVRFLQDFSYLTQTRFLENIRAVRKEVDQTYKDWLFSGYKKVVSGHDGQFATIAQLCSYYDSFHKRIETLRDEARPESVELVSVPAKFRQEYLNCCQEGDVCSPSSILEDLKETLSKEPITLGIIIRCFLMSVLLVIATTSFVKFMPIWIWISVLFLLPLLVFGFRLHRQFKRIRKLKARLLASEIRSINKKLSTVLYNEVVDIYDNLITECNKQKKKLELFKEQLKVDDNSDNLYGLQLPRTYFNQPLFGGVFKGEHIVRDLSNKDDVNDSDEVQLSLLRNAFQQGSFYSLVSLPESEDATGSATAFIKELYDICNPGISIEPAENICLMLNSLGGKVNYEPLLKMAGLSGMLVDNCSHAKRTARVIEPLDALNGMNYIKDEATSNYLLISIWQQLNTGLSSERLCNCSINNISAPIFLGAKLALYYGFYRRQSLAYQLGGIAVTISPEEMQKLDQAIRGGLQ